MLKGLVAATLCPATALTLVAQGKSQGYCGVSNMEEKWVWVFDVLLGILNLDDLRCTPCRYGMGYLGLCFLVIWIGSDFIEWFYHHLGHRYSALWEVHRHHHKFFNPSPFAVIADEVSDTASFCSTHEELSANNPMPPTCMWTLWLCSFPPFHLSTSLTRTYGAHVWVRTFAWLATWSVGASNAASYISSTHAYQYGLTFFHVHNFLLRLRYLSPLGLWVRTRLCFEATVRVFIVRALPPSCNLNQK